MHGVVVGRGVDELEDVRGAQLGLGDDGVLAVGALQQQHQAVLVVAVLAHVDAPRLGVGGGLQGGQGYQRGGQGLVALAHHRAASHLLLARPPAHVEGHDVSQRHLVPALLAGAAVGRARVVVQDEALAPVAAEVDHHVVALRGAHHHPVGHSGGAVQVAAVGADHSELGPGPVKDGRALVVGVEQLQVVEAAVGCVQHAEAVLAGLNRHAGPRLPVDNADVAKELGDDPVIGGVLQGTVGVEGPLLQHQGHVVLSRGQLELPLQRGVLQQVQAAQAGCRRRQKGGGGSVDGCRCCAFNYTCVEVVGIPLSQVSMHTYHTRSGAAEAEG